MRDRDEQRARLVDQLERDFRGPIEDTLRLPDCEDVVLNEDGGVWAKLSEAGWNRIGFLTSESAMAIITGIATLTGFTVGPDQPRLETILPGFGDRFEAIVPPISRSPVFAIRTRAKKVYSLAEFVRQGVMTGDQAAILRLIVERGETLLVSGGTGSGKTTLLNALLRHLAEARPEERVVIIEDTPELQCASPNHTALLATDTFSMGDCLRAALRLRPTRIIVGEVRGAEALTMLKAFNTGHRGGLCSIHANGAEEALYRLEGLVQEAIPGLEARTLAAQVQAVCHIDGPIPGYAQRRLTELRHVALHLVGAEKKFALFPMTL